MGFSGSFILTRAERPITELPAVQAVDSTPEWSARDGAWQILQLSPAVDVDDSLLAGTGAPALFLHVHDSDFAFVQAVDSDGPSWHCAFPREIARDYQVPEQWIGDPDEVTRRSVAWAEAAGFRPDPVAVRATLGAPNEPCAEDAALNLVHALGFRFDAGENLLDPR